MRPVAYNHRSHGEYPVSQETRTRLAAEARPESLHPLGGEDAGLPRAAPCAAGGGQLDQRGSSPGHQRTGQGRRERGPSRQQCVPSHGPPDECAGQACAGRCGRAQAGIDGVGEASPRIQEASLQARESESLAHRPAPPERPGVLPSAGGAEDLLENEAFDGKPRIQLAELDLLLDPQQVMEPPVEIGGAVIDRLPVSLLHDEGMIRELGL